MSGSQELKNQGTALNAKVLTGIRKGKPLTQELVKKLFDYLDDGNLVRKIDVSSAMAGDLAGSLGSSGYLKVKIDGRTHLAHRLIWLWHHGYLPEHGLDHVDRNKQNNRIGNLREVSQSCNLRNIGERKDNKSGVRGICWIKRNKKYVAAIRYNGMTKHLGQSKDFIEAVAYRLAAEQCLGWSNCDSSSPAYVFMQEYIKRTRILIERG